MVENQVANPVTIEQNISKPIRSEVADKETESPNTPLNTTQRCQLLRHDHHYETTPRSLIKRYQVFRKKIKAFRVKSKVQRQHIARLKKQVADLTEIVRELRRTMCHFRRWACMFTHNCGEWRFTTFETIH